MQHLPALFALFGAVVVVGAEGLPVGAGPEELLIPTMGDDVIHHTGWGRAARMGTAGMSRQVCGPFPVPLGVIATFTSRGPLLVILGFALMIAGDHVLATLAGGDHATT